MKILLLNPPFLPNFSRAQRSPAVTKSGTLYYPIWLAHATGVLEQAGHEVKLVDAPASGLTREDCERLVDDFQPQLLVLDTCTASIMSDHEVGVALKNRVPGAFLTLVGTHVSALPEASMALNPGIDAIAKGEYDYTLRELAAMLPDRSRLGEVLGLIFRQGDQVVRNADRPYIQNLDEIPFVTPIYKKFLDITKYFNPNSYYPMVQVISGRGCHARCTFCVLPQTLQGRSYRKRSVENVAAEFEYIQREMPEVQGVFFEDDTLTSDKERCRALSEELIRRGNRLKISANARADVDYETLRLMKKAGFVTVCVGFESGDQDLLNNIRKGIRIEGMHQFVKDARKAGILVHGCFMTGLPGETRETMQKTLDLAIALNPDTVQFYPIMVYPGTEAFDWYQANDYLTTRNYSNWLTSDGMHNTVIQLPGLKPQDLVQWCDDARRAFYLRPGYILSKLGQVLTNPYELKRKMKSARTFMRYLIKGSFSKQDDNKSC